MNREEIMRVQMELFQVTSLAWETDEALDMRVYDDAVPAA